MRMMDINCDCGESFGNWSMGADEDVLPFVTTANVACGFHGGDPATMERTVALAHRLAVAVGAHPGLPDLLGFGRRRMDITPDDAYAYVVYQAGALAAFLKPHGMRLNHVKPHGALYLMLNEREDLADAVARAVIDVCPEARMYWPAPIEGRAMPEAARAHGIRVVGEVYFDLRYDADRRLVLERKKRPLDLDDLRTRVADYLATGEITAITGERLRIEADSICVHGDGPNAADVARTIRDMVRGEGRLVAAAAE